MTGKKKKRIYNQQQVFPTSHKFTGTANLIRTVSQVGSYVHLYTNHAFHELMKSIKTAGVEKLLRVGVDK